MEWLKTIRIVSFTKFLNTQPKAILGRGAWIWVDDHPVVSPGWLLTSEVMAVFEDGFETLNTYYRQVKGE